MAISAPQVFEQDGIRIIIDDEDDAVRELPGGHLAIDQDDGGVVVRLNPPRSGTDKDADDPTKFYANLADKIDEGKLLVIANDLMEAVQADDQSRSEWLADRADRPVRLVHENHQVLIGRHDARRPCSRASRSPAAGPKISLAGSSKPPSASNTRNGRLSLNSSRSSGAGDFTDMALR